MSREPAALRDDLYRILMAVKVMADDMERRTNVFNDALSLRDMSIDSLLEHRDHAVMVLDLFKGFYNAAREVRKEFEDERDKDWGVSDVQWFAKFVAENCTSAQDDLERIRSLAAENAKMRARLDRLEAHVNLPVANDTH